MKTFKYITLAVLCSIGLFACSDENWDSHYSKQEEVIDNVEIVSVDKFASEFLQSASEYSTMYQLFKETGALETWQNKNLLYTIMVVNNDKITRADSDSDLEKAEKEFRAKAHITDALLSPSNLKNEQRLLMWNGKYVTVAKLEEATEILQPGTYFNGSKVKKVIKAKDAYIYELEEYVKTPKALMEYLEELPEEYSMFKKMVLDRTQKTFNKAASTPIGIDKTGNTVYDSVFTVQSKYFADKKLDIYSENITATLLVPSNELVINALKDAKERLASWNVEREDSVLNNWIFQTAFFNKKYVKEDFIYNENDPNSTQDLYSIFDQQWRTTVNKVDLDNPVELSNGIAYKVTSLKIPANKVLIWRFKEWFYTFDNLTEAQRAEYFEGYKYISTYLKDIGTNAQMNRVKQYVNSNQPQAWLPAVHYRAMMLWVVDADQPGIFKFKCYKMVPDATSTTGYTPVLYKIPPGEYNFYLGVYGARSNVNCTFYINGKKIPKCESGPITGATMKGANFDRNSGGYSELYKDSRYDRDGGVDLGLVTIEETTELEVTVEFKKASQTTFEPSHWCLRPTANTY
ncbi:hypothetical protein [Bacteroides sp. 224]|uniref:hypothetical protein n=1 Tax=Bacteroides sp. 224 TaxID=2302936 RepID=UPI0013D3E010|nr:hypothetical protein [Bacteroides sp. 224]NDV63654.1 hypothetical protein [Bacteroides sp. 224]